jgi:two-component system sensor histidine kinase RegB
MNRQHEWDIAPASKRNMMLLIQLRWMAVVGQLATIWFTAAVLHVHLPVMSMMTVLVVLGLVNLATLALSIGRRGFSYIELLGSLMLDVSALAWQLYQTGAAPTPSSSCSCCKSSSAPSCSPRAGAGSSRCWRPAMPPS